MKATSVSLKVHVALMARHNGYILDYIAALDAILECLAYKEVKL